MYTSLQVLTQFLRCLYAFAGRREATSEVNRVWGLDEASSQ